MTRRNQDRKVYIHLEEEGKHLALSRRTSGAMSGNNLRDDNNQACGSAEFMEIGMTVEDYLRAERAAATIGPIVERAVYAGVQALCDYGERKFQEKVMPKIEAGVLKLRENIILWGGALKEVTVEEVTGKHKKTKAEQISEERTAAQATEVTSTAKTSVAAAPKNAKQPEKHPITMEQYDAVTNQTHMLVTMLAL